MRLLAAKWRRGRDSNPCGVAPKRFSRPPRYDRFDTSPYMKLSFDRNHQIFNCFRNSFRNALLCCCQSAEKVRCCKAFQGFCDRCARKFSRPPRYDRFDIPPYLPLILYHKLFFLSTPFCYFLLLPFFFPISVFFGLQRIYTRKISVWYQTKKSVSERNCSHRRQPSAWGQCLQFLCS